MYEDTHTHTHTHTHTTNKKDSTFLREELEFNLVLVEAKDIHH